uniref:Uncharacterized protein n=1 Tax=Tanacetum cinerariifolium TaxID=118510 RepID=A0A699UZU6_TANCI|nr:hypothetical protein [Tanacetum cinerariifolium]
MSTSNVHQQSLADASSETRPPILKRGSYIQWTSRFRRYLNRKRENRKCLNKAIDDGPYEFKMFTPSKIEAPKMQKEEDLRGITTITTLLNQEKHSSPYTIVLLS